MKTDNVVEFHAPSSADGKPLYTTPQDRDLFCFDQGYTLGYAHGQADAAHAFMDEAEDDMRRWRGQVALLIVGGMLLGATIGWFVIAPLMRWWWLS